MTNKQAQTTINAIKFMLDHAQYSDDVEEALNMAINALTAQPETHDKHTEMHACDCVSRQAAIDALDNIRIPRNASWYQYYHQALTAMSNLPSVQPTYTDAEIQKMQDLESAEIEKAYQLGYEEGKKDAQQDQRWIPCSERLPEEGQSILVTTTDNAWGDVVIIRTYYKEMHKSVIAWMPLPEPYREDKE